MNLVSKIDETSSRLPPNSAPPRSASEVKNLLRRYQLRPSKRLGQNFLINEGAVKKIIEAADLQPDDIVLEIGPGIGVLTQELAKKAKKVIAVEKDKNMIEILAETLKDFKNVEIIHGDIRKKTPGVDEKTPGVETRKADFQSYKVVGNLPFYLTAPVIRKFLEAVEVRPQQMVLVVQKEVGQRICAKVPDMNLLAVSVQFYSKPEIISFVSKKSFWPQPKVDSAIITIVPRQFCLQVSRLFREQFFKIVRSGFSQPRKQLINNLSKGLNLDREKVESWLLENNIQPTQRAETLTLESWRKLTKSLK